MTTKHKFLSVQSSFNSVSQTSLRFCIIYLYYINVLFCVKIFESPKKLLTESKCFWTPMPIIKLNSSGLYK